MAGERRGIVTGGTWCVDSNRLIDFWPPEDGLAEILSEEVHGGGSACNLAIDMKQLDPSIPVETIGLIGDDEDGRRLLAEADTHGVRREQLSTTPGARTHATDAYTSRQSGRRTHIFNRGAGDLLTPDHFDFARTVGRILHLGLPGVHARMDSPWADDANGWVAVLRQARAAGLMTNMELASIPPDRLAALVRPCLPHLDLLIVNDSEISALSGKAAVADGRTDIAACIDGAQQVLAMGAMGFVVVHFPLGAVVLSRDGAVMTKPSVCVPQSMVAGANGAGDAFAAGFLYGLHEGWSMPDSLTLAHATAATSLRSVATTGAVEPWQKCLRLAETWGWRKEAGRR